MPPVHVMIKPASAGCNMRCSYCFYADEAASRQVGARGIMSPDTAAQIVKKALAHARGSCSFIFQGGEPTLAGLDFFRHFVELVNGQRPPDVAVSYAFQTNGLLIDEEWARFFADNRFLVGVSMDGPAEVHDRLRPLAGGGAFHALVLDRLRLLRRAGVECNVLTVVTRQLARDIARTYDFFKEEGILYQQYIPCMDPLDAARGGQAYSLTPREYAKFLHRLFVLWKKDLDRGLYVSVRHFDNWLSILLGRPPESCNMLGVCSVQYVVEADGSVYPCDFYCLDQWALGSVLREDFDAFDARRRQLGFVERSLPVPPECGRCPWRALCRNGCPRDRVRQPGQTWAKNYYCDAYREFFSLHFRDLQQAAGRLAGQNGAFL